MPPAATEARRDTSLPLLESKLLLPLKRPGTIRRTGLVNRMRARRQPTVTLVTAPLGYGKTTLLADWARTDERAFAWVSLDESDNDPVVFLAYVAEALDRIEPVDDDVFVALASPGASPKRVVAALGRSLSSFGVPAVLVLDDVHLIEEPETRTALTLVSDHLPEHVQLALGSRTGTPLPLARLRTEGRLVEIGADELRLGERDAAQLLQAAGVQLSADDVADLTQRTEGWPAGLYLAALALQHANQPTSAFRGADRYVGDYFRDELLGSLEPGLVSFLIRVSVLDRMCGALCDEIAEVSGSADILAELESSNLFVVPLDHERHWYRFHRLFRDMLRHELERRSPGLSRDLSVRAADWCEQQGDREGAIEYVHVAGDEERLVDLVSKAVLPTAWTGRFATVGRWFSWLDDPALLERFPALAVYGAEIYPLLGRSDDALRWAAAAERGRDEIVMHDGSPASAWKASLRARTFESGPEQAVIDAQQGLDTLAAGSPVRTNALNRLGTARLVCGDGAAADAAFAEAIESGLRQGAKPGVSFAYSMRSFLAMSVGDWAAATTYADDALAIVHELRLDHHVTAAFAFAAVGRTSLRRNDWTRAADHLERGERLLGMLTHVMPARAVKARLEFARARLAISDLQRVNELLDEITAILAVRPRLGVLVTEADDLRREVEARRNPDGWTSSFTAAELRVLPLLATHLSFVEIGERLYISRNTVKTHAIKIYRKLGANSRSDAIERAVELGLLNPGTGQ
jgi:LuxR family maltose regulon positive regulatory protein